MIVEAFNDKNLMPNLNKPELKKFPDPLAQITPKSEISA